MKGVIFEELEGELIVHIDVRNLSSLAIDCLKEEILNSYEITARLDHASSMIKRESEVRMQPKSI